MLEEILFVLRIATLASGIFLGASVFFRDLKLNGTLLNSLHPRVVILGTFAILAIALVGEVGLRFWFQYEAFKNGPEGRFLLPPYQPISYFLGYATFHFAAWRVLGVILAAILFWATEVFFVRRTQGLLVNRNEALLLSFGIAASGWPNLLVYLVSALLFYAITLFALTIREKTVRTAASVEVRFPISPALTLALLCSLIFGVPIINWLENSTGIILRFSSNYGL